MDTGPHNYRAHLGGFRFYERRSALYSHNLRHGAKFKREIDSEGLLDTENDVRLDHGFESGLLDLNVIVSRQQIRNGVNAVLVRCG